jgi:hypothetical protein
MKRSEMKNSRLTKRLINTILIACVFISGFQAMAQETDSIGKAGQVNKLFECTTNKPFPGASVIVIHHGKILLNKGYGLANIAQSEPNTQYTVFRLGSITKQFTAMAILQLYDKQMLQINDYVVLTPQIAGHNLKNKLGLIKFGNYGKNETKIYT